MGFKPADPEVPVTTSVPNEPIPAHPYDLDHEEGDE